MVKVLVTGSQGFIGSYICRDLLDNGYEVVGVDNYSKYGKLDRPHDKDPKFKLIDLDVLDEDFSNIVALHKPNFLIAGAAQIGGISFFHKFAYDLLANNERITAAHFDAAIRGWEDGWLNRIVVLSSSMVFESTGEYPTPEDAIERCPPPASTYGFSKLATEYFARGALEQYGLPFTICRPFNCVGVGEDASLLGSEMSVGNKKIMLSHVLPDLAYKCLLGQDPLEILGEGNQVRCYTHGTDVARGIRLAMESEKAVNQAFNLSSMVPTSVLQLARMIWKRVNPGKEFQYKSVEPFHYDVQRRVPDCSKARDLLGFVARYPLEESVGEVVEYMRKFTAQ